MGTTESHEREIRVARNHALFRALNENIKEVNLEFSVVADTFAIACECADETCFEALDISADEYAAIRADPRHFAVLGGHVYPDIEKVVAKNTTHVVVEKRDRAGVVAEAISATALSADDSGERSGSS
jgi:hypothetical protein